MYTKQIISLTKLILVALFHFIKMLNQHYPASSQCSQCVQISAVLVLCSSDELVHFISEQHAAKYL